MISVTSCTCSASCLDCPASAVCTIPFTCCFSGHETFFDGSHEGGGSVIIDSAEAVVPTEFDREMAALVGGGIICKTTADARRGRGVGHAACCPTDLRLLAEGSSSTLLGLLSIGGAPLRDKTGLEPATLPRTFTRGVLAETRAGARELRGQDVGKPTSACTSCAWRKEVVGESVD